MQDRNVWYPDQTGNNVIIHIDDCVKLMNHINGHKTKSTREAVALLKGVLKGYNQ